MHVVLSCAAAVFRMHLTNAPIGNHSILTTFSINTFNSWINATSETNNAISTD